MFYIRRTLAAVIVCFIAFPACAFTFSYGNLLEVKDVKNDGGVLQLPLIRRKYKNVKILSKELYRFLQKCSGDCTYQTGEVQLQIEEFRPAATRADMFIADVSLNGEILLTFLVFQNKKNVSVKSPEVIHFKDKKLQERIQKYIVNRAAEKV